MAALSLANDASGKAIYRRTAVGNRWLCTGRIASVTNGGADTIVIPKVDVIETMVLTPVTNNVDGVVVSFSTTVRGQATIQSSGTTSDMFFAAICK